MYTCCVSDLGQCVHTSRLGKMEGHLGYRATQQRACRRVAAERRGRRRYVLYMRRVNADGACMRLMKCVCVCV